MGKEYLQPTIKKALLKHSLLGTDWLQWEQTIMNDYFLKSEMTLTFLGSHYNCFKRCLADEEDVCYLYTTNYSLINPLIIHYVGHKPWNDDNITKFKTVYQIWKKYHIQISR